MTPRAPPALRQNCRWSRSPAPARIASNSGKPGLRGFMSSHQYDAARPLTPGAIALMLLLCLSWAFNQVAVKLALPDIPPMLQALIRSSGAILVLLAIARLRGVKMFERDGTLAPGLVAGAIFGIEFILIYRGLLLTSAS